MGISTLGKAARNAYFAKRAPGADEWDDVANAVVTALGNPPSDCRCCEHFRATQAPERRETWCASPIRCVDASRYKPMHPVQMWEQKPAPAGF